MRMRTWGQRWERTSQRISIPARAARSRAVALLCVCLLAAGSAHAQYTKTPVPAEFDTALIVSVDISSSVDEHRYRLQMEGIAAALEDPTVQRAILTGPLGGVLFTMVTWADKPQTAVPWTGIKSKDDALATAELVRQLPRRGGEFTCLSKMLRFLSESVVPRVPARAQRTVIDVSGDGRDNCSPEEPVPEMRDELVAANAIVNGLPILEGREAETLASWYRDNVMGGPGSFVVAAAGYDDFARAIKQKFVLEISSAAAAGPRAEAVTSDTWRLSPGVK